MYNRGIISVIALGIGLALIGGLIGTLVFIDKPESILEPELGLSISRPFQGGTGTSSIPSQTAEFLIWNDTTNRYDSNRIVAGAGITLTPSDGNLTIEGAAGLVENIFSLTSSTLIEATTTNAGIGLQLDFFTATSTTATSTFAGGLTIETTGFVYDRSTNSVGIGLVPISGVRLLLPQEDDAVTPTLAFGDGNTGIYESGDNVLRFSSNGTARFQFNGAFFRSVDSAGPGFVNEAASDTNPTFLPDTSDGDTGIGQASEDELSLIAGAVEMLRLDQDLLISFFPTGNVGIGTTSPYAKLSVVGEVVASHFTATSTTNASTFDDVTVVDISATNVIISGDTINDFAGDGLTVTGNALTADLGTAIVTGEITNGTILEIDLNASNAPADNDILTFNNADSNFTWNTPAELSLQAQDDVLDDLSALSVIGDNEFIVGTGAGVYANESGATVRTSLGLTIGTDVQAEDVVLTDLAALSAVADNEVIVGTGAGTYAHESGATLRTSIGVDAAGTDNSTDVTLSGSRDYFTLSGQDLVRGVVDISDDTNAVGGTGLTITGDSFAVDLGTSIVTGEITDGTILEVDLDAASAANDNEILTYNAGGSNFDWSTLLELSIQPLDSELTTIAGLTETNGNVMFVAGGAWTSDATPAIDCTDCTNIPSGTSHTGTLTWGGTAILESGIAFQFGDASDATLTHTYANTGTNVVIAYSSAVMDITTGSLRMGGSEVLVDTDLGGSVQAQDAVLDDLAALGVIADNEFIVGTGAGTYANESGATVRTSLGLGSAAVVATDLGDLNEATIEASIDTLANLISIQGLTVTFADAGADAIWGWDDTASAYENLTQSEVLAIIGSATLTAQGVIEIATVTETNTGTDATRAVSPDGLDGWTGSAQVTTLGTIATGVWEGTTVAVNQGGTGATTLNNLITLTTHTTGNYADGDGEAGAALTGDSATSFFSSGTIEHERGGLQFDANAITTGGLIRGASSGVMSILTVGSDGQVLTAQADSSVAWEAVPTGIWKTTGNMIETTTALNSVVIGTSTVTTNLVSLTVSATSTNTTHLFSGIDDTGTQIFSISNSGFGTTTLAGLNISGLATSTSNVGYDITTGCFSILGTCVGGGGGGASDINDLTDGFVETGNLILGHGGGSIGTSDDLNTAVGIGALDALNNSGGDQNTAFGSTALSGVTSGDSNTAIGQKALEALTSGVNNVAVGNSALVGTSGGDRNTSIGSVSGLSVINNGDDNTFLGYQSGLNTTNGDHNLFLGSQSGDNVTTGSNNIVIGGNTIDATSATLSNQLNIGNIIFGTAIDGTGTTISTGNIGIASTSPSFDFVVGASGLDSGDTTFTNTSWSGFKNNISELNFPDNFLDMFVDVKVKNFNYKLDYLVGIDGGVSPTREVCESNSAEIEVCQTEPNPRYVELVKQSEVARTGIMAEEFNPLVGKSADTRTIRGDDRLNAMHEAIRQLIIENNTKDNELLQQRAEIEALKLRMDKLDGLGTDPVVVDEGGNLLSTPLWVGFGITILASIIVWINKFRGRS